MRSQIYILINPNTDEIFYVGKTTQPLLSRLMCHCYSFANSRNGVSHKEAIIKQIIHNGKLPLIQCVEIVSNPKIALDRELYWIKLLKSEGCPITNREVVTQRQNEIIYTDDFPYGISILKTENMKKNCFQCGHEFEGARKTIFCSEECKKKKGKIPTVKEVANLNGESYAKEFLEKENGIKKGTMLSPPPEAIPDLSSKYLPKSIRDAQKKEMPAGLGKIEALRWLKANR